MNIKEGQKNKNLYQLLMTVPLNIDKSVTNQRIALKLNGTAMGKKKKNNKNRTHTPRREWNHVSK